MGSELLAKIASLRLPLVLGEGPLVRPKLLFLGEALGETEVQKRRPFAGWAGEMFDGLLKKAGVQRGECHVMNVIPTRPPENNVGRLGEIGLSLQECMEWCRERIAEIKPKVVVALGDIALRAVTEHSGITDWRGSPISRSDYVVVPAFHPSYIRRLPDKTARKEREGEQESKYTYGSAKLTAILDIQKAKRIAGNSRWGYRVRYLQHSPSFEEARTFLARVKAAKGFVTFDIETRGRWVEMISFALSPNEAICITRETGYWKPAEEEYVWAETREILATHGALVAQNGLNFDIPMLYMNGIPVRGLFLDTMIAHHYMYAELPHDLHYLASIYTDEPFFKWMRVETGAKRREYNCLDTVTDYEIAETLIKELHELGLYENFENRVMPLAHATALMGARGVLLDMVRKSRLQRALAFLIEKASKRAKEALEAPELNLRSPKQLMKLLYEKMGLPKQFKRKKNAKGEFPLTTDEAAIEKLVKLPKGKGLRVILDVRDVEKKKSSYADVEVEEDNRLRTQYLTTGTETGRLSAKQTLMNTGWNAQTCPPWFKRLIVPAPGNEFMEADLKYAEALLIAWYAKDWATIEAVKKGIDIYKWHGARMLGVPPETIDKDQRDTIKPVVLGCGYGLGPIHMQELLEFVEKVLPDGRDIKVPTGITQARAKELRDLFFRSCPAILQYHEWVRETVAKERVITNAFGRRRIFLGRENDDLWRKAYAFLPQSTCVDYTNFLGLVPMSKIQGQTLRLQIHDALLLEYPATEEWRKFMLETMIRLLGEGVVIHGEKLVIPLEVKVSQKNWKEMEELGVFNKLGEEGK